MIIVRHRVNTLRELATTPGKYGVEIDVRARGNKLYLNHEPFQGGDDLNDYLTACGEQFKGRFIIFNVKEAGIEERIHGLAAKHGLSNYFLLDVEAVYLYKAAEAGERRVAVRYSESEPIESAINYKGKVDWVWIDTQTRLPLDADVCEKLRGFKTALVMPDRWGRPERISEYLEKMKELGFEVDLVMTGSQFLSDIS